MQMSYNISHTLIWNHICKVSWSNAILEIGLLDSHLLWGPLNSKIPHQLFSCRLFCSSHSVQQTSLTWPFQVSHSLDSLPGRSTCEAHEEESDWHMKGLQSARMAAEDGARKHCPHSAPSKEEKALYWKGNDPRWTCCHMTSLFFKPPTQQLSTPMNPIPSSDLCLTVAVACKVINHRYCAAVDQHANARSAFSCRNPCVTSACVRRLLPQHVTSFHSQPETFPPWCQISKREGIKSFNTLFGISIFPANYIFFSFLILYRSLIPSGCHFQMGKKDSCSFFHIIKKSVALKKITCTFYKALQHIITSETAQSAFSPQC